MNDISNEQKKYRNHFHHHVREDIILFKNLNC